MAGTFDLLHPAVRHHIVNSLGWRTLRPLQEQAIEPVLRGDNALLVAPTAGGKTEAAVFPLFSRMLQEDWRGLAVLYVCPLRALLNNLEARLAGYGHLLGRRVALWHGDVGRGERRAIQRDPPDLLLTTPESLEVMLVAAGIDHRHLFSSLLAVVVDELHAFAGDDRGWHLLSVLERISRVAEGDLQRIGLSATVGNPEQLIGWLAGSSARKQTVVALGGGPATEAEVQIDFVGNLDNAAQLAARLYRGEKRLVFCDSRARVEELTYRLRELGAETFVSHGSLGLDERRRAERAFAEGRDALIVSTSTLELGIDVGDLDRVLQIDAPGTVSSFLQRLGRSGRRPGTRRHLLFVATSDESLLRAAALALLWDEGFVEPLAPPILPYSIYSQQVLALVHQIPGIPRAQVAAWLDAMPGFAALAPASRETVLGHLLEQGWLYEDSGLLGPGPATDRRFRGKGFLDLFSVFETAPLIRVLHGRRELGAVDEATFQLREPEGTLLLLGGRSWRVIHLDWRRREAHVEAIEIPGRSLWPGLGAPESFALCQAQKRVLLGAGREDRPTRRARPQLDEVRGRFPWLSAEATTLEPTARHRARWWTFAGLRANASLADYLRGCGARVTSRDNLALTLDTSEGLPPIATWLNRIPDPKALEPTSLADEALESLKFAFCTPERLNLETLRARLSDPEAVAAVVGMGVEMVAQE